MARPATLAGLVQTPAKEDAMPGISGRMSTVIKAKISKLLDRAEDPAETLDYSYQKQMELLQNVKKGIAEVARSGRQARHAGASGARAGQRGSRPHGARAQERSSDRAAVARHPDRAARAAAGADDRFR